MKIFIIFFNLFLQNIFSDKRLYIFRLIKKHTASGMFTEKRASFTQTGKQRGLQGFTKRRCF